MAAPAVARSSGPPLCPSFAEVCSFLERYGAALDLPELTFPQIERYLRDTTAGERSVAVGRKKWWEAATLEAEGASTTTGTFIIVMLLDSVGKCGFVSEPDRAASPLDLYRLTGPLFYQGWPGSKPVFQGSLTVLPRVL